jgi:transaldolase/transaldolase/glucose-6-phosphate isomerase
LKVIREFGQSIWLDFFDRKIMDSGELERLMEEDGISGVTSNPSIFEKAIVNSPDYDQDIRALFENGDDNEEIFLAIAVKDIQWAADLFRPLYNETDGNDGLVSIEVLPQLAHDTKGTIEQARKLWNEVNRKNVMIKIPATTEGIPAIRTCISEGININITLLFGLTRYQEVADAYMSGLEDRISAGQSISQITSVASFFLSRIDVALKPVLQEKGLGFLHGEVAISSAKKAYSIYHTLFNSERFKALEAKAAKRQHLLWASTSSKDPSFSDVKYVEALIGPETINTLPPETIAAFVDHGKAGSHLEDDLDHATAVLAQVKDKEFDMDLLAEKLESEGIEKFNKAYEKLLKAIEVKKKKVSVNGNTGQLYRNMI